MEHWTWRGMFGSLQQIGIKVTIMVWHQMKIRLGHCLAIVGFYGAVSGRVMFGEFELPIVTALIQTAGTTEMGFVAQAHPNSLIIIFFGKGLFPLHDVKAFTKLWWLL